MVGFPGVFFTHPNQPRVLPTFNAGGLQRDAPAAGASIGLVREYFDRDLFGHLFGGIWMFPKIGYP